jgi:PBP1b-binding outer membrane lipoprotein LpoB
MEKPMKRIVALFTLILLSTIFLSGCASNKNVSYVEGEEKDTVAAQAEPYLQHILDGIAQNDYQLFITDFDATMLKAMTQTQFDAIVKTYGKLGQVKSTELSSVDVAGDYYGVNYKVTYEKTALTVRLVLPKEEPRLVSGLWFK